MVVGYKLWGSRPKFKRSKDDRLIGLSLRDQLDGHTHLRVGFRVSGFGLLEGKDFKMLTQ